MKRRPSRESRSIGVIRDIVRRDSDVADDRSSPELGYTPTGRKDSVMNNNNSPLEQLSPAPKENGRHQAPEPEETTADFSPEANKENVEVDAPKPSQDPPVPKPKPSRPASEPEVPKVEEEVQVVPDSRNSRVSSSQAPEEVQEHMTERELESAVSCMTGVLIAKCSSGELAQERQTDKQTNRHTQICERGPFTSLVY